MTETSLLEQLEARDLVAGRTDRDSLEAALKPDAGVFAGFDPTAASLHVGHLVGLVTLARLTRAGCRCFAVVGSATAAVGDPSGRDGERPLSERATLNANVAGVRAQIERLTGAEVLDNGEWTDGLTLVEFLRDVGKHFNLNAMLARDSVARRRETGLSFTEFSYQLLQANDFRELNRRHNVTIQIGGSDQWGNIVAGLELARRSDNRTLHGLTWPLLVRGDGTKFGKTSDGAIWLDAARTSPFAFHQFLMRVPDDAVATMLTRLSFRETDAIGALLDEHRQAPERRVAQHALADDVTSFVHGPVAAGRARDAAAALFPGAGDAPMTVEALRALEGEMPSVTVRRAEITSVEALCVAAGVTPSRSAARRLVSQHGLHINGRAVEDLEADGLDLGELVLIRRGKREQTLVRVTG